MQEEFFRRHAFKLGSKRLLSEVLQERLRKAFNTTPKTFKLELPDKLLLLNILGTSLGNSVTFLNGQMPKASEIIVDPVADVNDLWFRLRALLNTLAYVSVPRPAWFSIGDAEEISDQFFVWMNTKYEGRRLSLQFFLAAYVATFQHFYEEVRLHETSLSTLVKNVSAYRPFWTQTAAANPRDAAPAMSPPALPRSSNSAVPDSGGNVEVLRAMSKLTQQNEKLFTKVENMKQHGNKGGGNGGNGGGKGGNGQNDKKRYRGNNDNDHSSNHGKRTDEDGRTYVKVRKGPDSHRNDGHRNNTRR